MSDKSVKYYSYLFLLIYLIIGIYLCLTTGISHDEFHEQTNWEINLKAIKSFFLTGEYNELLNYKDKYHGIGFQLISQPIQYFITNIFGDFFSISDYGLKLFSKHIVVFFLFSFSGYYFYLISKKIIQNVYFPFISTSIYLLYPYLFGHSHFNPKDIPFLSFWVIATYCFIRLFEKFIKNENIKFFDLIFLSLSTSLLVSTRIVGFLILFQYLVFFFVYLEISKKTISSFKTLLKTILKFLILLFLFIFIFNPIFWHNPLEIFNSILWMKKYQQEICTLTLGNCLQSLNLPASYYFIWFFFKLPILIILGLFLFPFVEKKISKDKISGIIIYSFIITVFLILFLFIFLNVAIYDELRHIMFLIPLIFLISLSFLFHFDQKIFTVTSLILALLFILENYKINPYQYTWMNSFAKFYSINKNFEVDYWGISTKEIQKEIVNDHNKKKDDLMNIKKNCIYGGMYADLYLKKEGFLCFKSYSELDNAKDRPYYVIKNFRNLKRSNPKDCNLIHQAKYKYLLGNQEILTGSLWYCD